MKTPLQYVADLEQCVYIDDDGPRIDYTCAAQVIAAAMAETRSAALEEAAQAVERDKQYCDAGDMLEVAAEIIRSLAAKVGTR